MAKNGKGLTVFALIFGLIGAGAGGYVLFQSTIGPMLGLRDPYLTEVPDVEIPGITTYYEESLSFSPVTTSWTTAMQIEVNVTQNSSLYAVFNCYVEHSILTVTEVRFHIDGEITSSYTKCETDDDNTPLTLQYVNSTMTPGVHSIAVRVAMNIPMTNYLRYLSLYVQTITIIE